MPERQVECLARTDCEGNPHEIERSGSTFCGLSGSITVSVSMAMYGAFRARAIMRSSAGIVSTVTYCVDGRVASAIRLGLPRGAAAAIVAAVSPSERASVWNSSSTNSWRSRVVSGSRTRSSSSCSVSGDLRESLLIPSRGGRDRPARGVLRVGRFFVSVGADAEDRLEIAELVDEIAGGLVTDALSLPAHCPTSRRRVRGNR
jgi:hypothetical protein